MFSHHNPHVPVPNSQEMCCENFHFHLPKSQLLKRIPGIGNCMYLRSNILAFWLIALLLYICVHAMGVKVDKLRGKICALSLANKEYQVLLQWICRIIVTVFWNNSVPLKHPVHIPITAMLVVLHTTHTIVPAAQNHTNIVPKRTQTTKHLQIK